MPTSTPDWPNLRAEFPALESCTYLDTASFGQLPKCASQAVIDHLLHRDQTASMQFLSWFDHMDVIRESCAHLIHAHASDIAFVPNASTGLSFLMHGLKWDKDDEVLCLEGEFPNQIYGATRRVPWPQFYASVNDYTRVVLMSTVNYATGFRPPIEEVSEFLRERGILFYVDGTQSLGALDFDVRQIQPAMLCVDAYKWLLSPNGAGFVYIDPDLRAQLSPSIVGWRSDAGWRNVSRLNHGAPVFAESAQKFESGMLPFPSLYGMGAALDFLLACGPMQVQARVLELASKTRSMLAAAGAEVMADGTQIVKARFPARDSNELAASLKTKNVIVSARYGWLRVSPHFYNNEEDIEALRLGIQC